MYTAIQANNIAHEHYQHKYYRWYRYYTKYIMKYLVKNAQKGLFDLEFSADDSNAMTMQILRQIADELAVYGYTCKVWKDQDNKHKFSYGVISISWKNI